MNRTIIATLTILFLMGCSNNQANMATEVEIRLSNVSAFDFKNIKVITTGPIVNYQNLNSKQKSEYKTFESAYRYAFVELEIDGKVYLHQPVDYVGETLLKNGKYTYELGVYPIGKPESIGMTLIVD